MAKETAEKALHHPHSSYEAKHSTCTKLKSHKSKNLGVKINNAMNKSVGSEYEV